MRAWREERDFLPLLEADGEVTQHLPVAELREIFDYSYFLRNINRAFERLGLAAPEPIEGVR